MAQYPSFWTRRRTTPPAGGEMAARPERGGTLAILCGLQATTTKSRTEGGPLPAETSQNAAIIVARVLSKYALYFDEAELSTKAANRANLAL